MKGLGVFIGVGLGLLMWAVLVFIAWRFADWAGGW